eukprot:GAHX01001528.1.p1 GENE.GAHX01001528.1~~GAHX01001528.1.p1  ORF type:complete len:217 (-),score=62.01 GAHX01001528.1:42-692(-)
MISSEQHIGRITDFIIKEASEKADEIKTKTENDFLIKKHEMIVHGKKSIVKDYKKKIENENTKKKIANSQTNKQLTLKIADEQCVMLSELYKQALLKTNKSFSKDVLLDALIESVLYINCNEVYVVTMKKDLEIIKDVIGDVNKGLKKLTGKDKEVTINIETEYCLDDGYKGVKSKCGGIVVVNKDRNVVVDNTIENRVKKSLEFCKVKINKIFKE